MRCTDPPTAPAAEPGPNRLRLAWPLLALAPGLALLPGCALPPAVPGGGGGAGAAPAGAPGATAAAAAGGASTAAASGSSTPASAAVPGAAAGGPGAAPAAAPAAAATAAAPAAGAAQPGAPAPPPVRLEPPVAARSWGEFRVQAARRLVAANPGRTFLGPVPEPLLAIPVLEVELHADGSVRGVRVLRQPGQARDTVRLAIDAVHRAAPFGAMSRLPRPWKFVEVFLFDDQRRFKPRTLDL